MLMHNSGVDQGMNICHGISGRLLGRLLDACPLRAQVRKTKSWSWHGNLALLDSVLALLFLGGLDIVQNILFDTMQWASSRECRSVP